MKKVGLQKVIEDCKKSTKSIKVKDVAEVFEMSISALYQGGSILKRIREKIGDDDFNGLITSIMCTTLSTIYTNTQFDNIDDMITYGKEINASFVGIKK